MSGQHAEWNNRCVLATRSTQSWTRLLIRARRYDVSVVFTFTLWCSSGFTSYPTVVIYGNGNPKCFIPGFSGSTHEKDHLLSIISSFLSRQKSHRAQNSTQEKKNLFPVDDVSLIIVPLCQIYATCHTHVKKTNTVINDKLSFFPFFPPHRRGRKGRNVSTAYMYVCLCRGGGM